MPSEFVLLRPDDLERRLHPLSWLFVVLQQLKSFAVPVFVVLVTGRGNRYEFVGLIGVGGVALLALLQYFTYRFRLGPESVVITSGVFQRTRRDIPYGRIHDVVLHQSLLHRLCGVAEVRLESAGGKKAEGQMRVLSLSDAQAIERLIRERGQTRVVESAGEGTAAPELVATPLLAMNTAEVIRLGLISNRGMVLVAAAFGGLWQFLPNDAPNRNVLWRAYEFLTREGSRLVPNGLPGPVGLAATSVLLLLAALVLVRALSVLLALLQFHGFTLHEVGRQLRVERGLLTRVRHHLPRKRIQAWRVSETVLHRWCGRQSLRVDSAVGADEGREGRGARDLAPLATPAAMHALINHLLPGRTWPPPQWRRLHPRAWRRLIVTPTAVIIGVSAGLIWQYGALGAIALGLVPLGIVRARRWAEHAGYAEVSGGLVAVREGWLNKSWRFTETRKLQSLRLTESPFDRRSGMATLWLDTAGASAREGAIRIPYLPVAEARSLYAHLAAEMDAARR